MMAALGLVPGAGEEDSTLNERDLVTLVFWLTGLALLMWRSRDGARVPWWTAAVGAAVWCALPHWEPSLRTVRHFGLTAALLFAGLVRRWPRPAVGD